MTIKLTVAQRKVVNHDEGALLVVAGPGSGKTRVLTERIRRLLARPDEHFRVLALTFTNKAANEMAERLESVPQIAERAFIGTMHRFCVEVLANRGKSVGIQGLPHIFESYADRKQILREAVQADPDASRLLRQAGDAKAQGKLLDTWMNAISEAKNSLMIADMVEDAAFRNIYQIYDAAIRACKAVDFDDLLLLTYRVFEERPAIAAFYRRQFRYICVDEAQDLNEAQYRVLCALCGNEYFNVMMVGDPKQAIFTWNGADPKYLDLFKKEFRAARIELRENFRSSKSVIRAAQALSPEYEAMGVFPVAGEVRAYECENERDEAEFVADKIMSLICDGHEDIEGTITPERCAILGRNRFVFTPIIEVLEERGIEFCKKLSAANVESGSELVTQFELALRIIANPMDRLHVGMLAKEWKTGLSAECIYEGLDLREMTGMEVVERIIEEARGSSNAAIIHSAVEFLDWSPSSFKLIPALDCLELHAGELEDEPRNRVVQDIRRWKQHWNYYVRNEQGGAHSIGAFLSQVALGTTQQPRQDGVALLTVHSAKGMEFEVVFVIGMNEGTFPDFRAVGDSLDEERRNAFVAVTRSRRLLYLSYPKKKMMPWGDEKTQRPSRFIEPIMKTMLVDKE
ncbi:MAG: ATP-dependent helicase [Planctomycetaceae bacterium]